ncbi:MAG: PIG-L deacetylase family protein [Actinomycetota bacterium]
MAEPLRVLVVSAHPDDIEFSCAGSVAVWVDEGAEVTYCIVTDGSTGTADRELVGERLAEIRRDESERAAKTVGVEDVIFLGYRDGYVEPTLELRRDIARVFRRARPNRMVVMDPVPVPGGWFVNHPDHRAVGQASLDVTVTAGTTPGHFPELLDEGLEPWKGLREIYVAGPGGGEFAVDITSTIDRKIAALQCHASQVGDWDVDSVVRAWTKEMGGRHGYEHAELFHVLGTMEARRNPEDA